ncbi:MAG: FAD-binding oxidoreductase [Saprospiraceae bacterium]|nr:FAD-binding oxidoreductase [Saprospiraceae bacterium]
MTQQSFFDKLQQALKGELYHDDLHRSIYATDASNYQIMPVAVVMPKDENDVIRCLQFCREYGVPLLGRGGGTSLVGQTVAEAVVLDFTKYMNNVVEVNAEESWAWVQAGVVRDVLNDSLKPDGLHFAPDPATSSRATVGGMIANNSSGTRSIMYGKTSDHVLELRVLLSDGTICHFKDLSSEEMESKCEQKDREGSIYRGILQLTRQYEAQIKERFPKIMRRVGAYALDNFGPEQHWNMSQILLGSEGTLGIILSAKIRLVENPIAQALCVVHFEDFFDSISHIAYINRFGPASVELLDKLLVQRSRENIETRRYCDFVEGNPGGVLVVEFYGANLAEAQSKAHFLADSLRTDRIAYAWPVLTEKSQIEAVFTIRKKGLGLLMGVKGNRKPIAFIEDAAVPVEHLADYIREVYEVCHKHGTEVVAYAHASVGLLHVKPLLDLRDKGDIERMKRISEDVLQLVIKYKGSWSGEHGDGLARSPYNRTFFGDDLMEAFDKVKRLFDPLHLLNPGKIVDSPPVDQNLRYGTQYQDAAYKSMFHFRDEGGFADSVHLCNGVGECRKQNGGSMCPSFRATKEEKDSTRGRANALRMALSGQLDREGLNSPALADALDLCLSCKACKSECPSNVDMSKLKSEVLHHRNRQNGLNFKSKLIRNQNQIGSMFTGALAPMVNTVMRTRLFRYLLEKISGLDRRRVLPLYRTDRFTFTNPREPGPKAVVLYADTYMRLHEPNIGYKAKKVLEHLGYQVFVVDKGCCQRPAISKGLLDVAKQKGEATFEIFEKYFNKDIPVLICEPSCASAFRDDLPDLIDDEKWGQMVQNHVFLLEDFLVKEAAEGKIALNSLITKGEYLLHAHCHQKSMFTSKAIHKIFGASEGVVLREIESGCCGMAGSFGYEKSIMNFPGELPKQLYYLHWKTQGKMKFLSLRVFRAAIRYMILAQENPVIGWNVVRTLRANNSWL